MKKFLLMLFLLIALPNALNAQVNRFFVNLGAGISVPLADDRFADLYNMGFNIHAAGGIIFSSVLAGRLDVQLNRFSQDEDDPNASGSLTITSIKADLLAGQVMGTRNVNPYGVFGLGAYNLSVSVTSGNVTISDSETNLGIGVGAGINFKLSPSLGIYTEIQYNVNFNDDGAAKSYLPLKVGVHLLP